MLERDFQRQVIQDLKLLLPGVEIMKNDAGLYPGVPDLIFLFGTKWGMLEVKASPTAKFRPNQEYYVDKFNDLSFARVIHPQNKESIFDEIQRTFKV